MSWEVCMLYLLLNILGYVSPALQYMKIKKLLLNVVNVWF